MNVPERRVRVCTWYNIIMMYLRRLYLHDDQSRHAMLVFVWLKARTTYKFYICNIICQTQRRRRELISVLTKTTQFSYQLRSSLLRCGFRTRDSAESQRASAADFILQIIIDYVMNLQLLMKMLVIIWVFSVRPAWQRSALYWGNSSCFSTTDSVENQNYKLQTAVLTRLPLLILTGRFVHSKLI